MKSFLTILLIGSCILLSCALPVTKPKKQEEKHDANTPESPEEIEYKRYLNEVVEALETDKEFRRKLEKSSKDDIHSGKTAEELDYANHNVRSKLDEVKRRELERLRHLASKKFELENEIDRDHLKVNHHLDHANEQDFEKDLDKLIKDTVSDLAEVDKKREAEFKEYEMRKEFERQMSKQKLDEEQRKKLEEKENQRKGHHEKVHHPGNKAQLEDVWENQDHMDKQEFNPRTFFNLHDLDGNGFWDETEVKALFVKELDKIYKTGAPEVDMRERAEEMERMREHVFKETDTNGDNLINYDEFIDQTKRDEYNRDPEWQTIDEQPQYTHEEYLEFERRRREEIDRMIAQGLQQPPSYQQHPQMHYQDPQQQHLQQQQQYHQQQQQYYQQQYHPQQYQQQPQPQPQHQAQQVHLNSNQIYQQIPVKQQQQPVANSLPSQQQHQPIVNNAIPEKPAANNMASQQQSIPNNMPSQQQPPVANNLPLQQQPINNVAPQLPVQNVQPQQNIPQNH